jgi:hypothetical protein
MVQQTGWPYTHGVVANDKFEHKNTKILLQPTPQQRFFCSWAITLATSLPKAVCKKI